MRQLLATWVVHDLSHISQITRVMARGYTEAVGPRTSYFKVLQKVPSARGVGDSRILR